MLVPFGDDMKFQNALKQYSNMDKLIAEANLRVAFNLMHKPKPEPKPGCR